MNGGVIAACALILAGAATDATEANAVGAIERYCQASWSRAAIDRQDWHDCTQEVLIELLQRAAQKDLARQSDDGEQDELNRELTRSIWAVAQRWRRRHQYAPLNEVFVADRENPQVAEENDEMQQILERASESLTDRQKQIVALSIDGYSVAEIADELAMTTARVSDEKYKAIRRLKDRISDFDVV